MHRLFPFSSNMTTSGAGASTTSPDAQTSLSSSPPSTSSVPKPKQPPIDRRQSLDAYRPLADRLRSHLSASQGSEGSGSTTPTSTSESTSGVTVSRITTTATSDSSGGKLRRSTSASSAHSSGSNGRPKNKLKNLWHRVSGSVTSIPGAFLGGGDGQSAKSGEAATTKTAAQAAGTGDQAPLAQESTAGQPQLLYFMGSRPSTATTPTSSTPTTSTAPLSNPIPQDDNPKPQGRHAKLLSMVDEGAEDDAELAEYDRDESSSDSSDEEAVDVRSGETTAVNSPAAPSQHVLPPNARGLSGSGTQTPTQRQTSRYVDPFATPAMVPMSVPPNSPEAVSAALPATQATSMSFASFLGLSSSKPSFGFGSASAAPANEVPEGGEKPKIDPESLAQRIQELIDALPPPPIFNEIPQTPYPPTPYPPETPDGYPGSPFPSRLPPPPKPRVPKRDSKTGRPIPPPDAVPPGVDEEVVKLLWSVSVMGDQALPEAGKGGGEDGGKDGKGVEEGEGEEKPEIPETPKPNPDQRRRLPRSPVPRTPRTPRSPRTPHNRHGRHPRTPGTRNIWQILEGYNTGGHIPATPYTGIGSGGTGAPGSVIPLPPVEEDDAPDLGGPIAGGDREGDSGAGCGSGGGEGNGGQVGGDTGTGGPGGPTNLFSDGGSIMLYSPLIPGLHDLVEMGEVVDVLWEDDDEDEDDEDEEDTAALDDLEYREEESRRWGQSEGGTTVVGSDDGIETPKAGKGKARAWVPSLNWWPSQTVVQGKEQVEDRTPSPTLSAYGSPAGVSSAVRKAVAGSGAVHKRQGRTKDGELAKGKKTGVGRGVKTRRVVAERAWAPSKDKMSVQVFWWGYRLCLPPPTLAILSDKTIEATKRAAMITTALTWFLQNVPVTALPLPLQPTVLLLQRLAPYLGYVGTFISWSWQQIKSYDQGKGVLLTATWLLPIALIPGTWFDHSFPEPPPAPPAPPALPAPAPPAKSPTDGGKPEAETPAPAPAPSPPSESTPDTNPTPSPDPPASSTPVDTPPVTSPTTPEDPEEDADAKGQFGKRTRKTSLTQTIASFVSRKAKIPSGLRSRKNSTSAVVPSHDNRVVAAPPAAPVAQVSRISSTSTSLTSPMVSVGGLPPAQRRHTGGSSADESGVAFPSAAGEGVQSFAALADSSTETTTPVGVQAGEAIATTPMIPSAASTGGFVASGMLSPLTPGVAPPTQGGGYLPSPPDSPSPAVAPKATNKLKKRNSLTSRATVSIGSRPETKRKPTLGMNAVHPDSELGQELVKSWRVGTVDLPVPSPGVGKGEDGEVNEGKE